ncbi:LTA synthase family protein [Bacteroides helcogenes]|uniref:Sulfatase n=1 Tax=Bacteroides helcogenes (strain ATCC 35417 / DSM 20613 / JCM 6297 / CCUG 15421 / P 36-108) TaxID=693979 RepID=E6SQC2_BACT6|nr:alkaline phosphatase family protein [Bacteroides helcogenes]ADV44969.1 sulfatase [Bacteroides helcogenes P 36-108]MDY5239826.1 sulfatase-like hydrolase/transferase [Bacteroides helcogenes]
MRERLIGFIKTYCLFICIFILQKPLFMLYYYSFYGNCSYADWFSVIWHGLPLDLSLAGYLTVIPGFLFVTSVWTLSTVLHRIWCGYYLVISILLSIVFIVDLGLYAYWGFRLDTTPLFYFFSSPKDAVASVSFWTVLGGIAAMAVYAVLLYSIFYNVLLRKKCLLRMKLPYRRLTVSGLLLLFTGLLFIPIRGGFTVSTMNVGKVYFSPDQRLNHAAINPVFSLMESLSKQKDFSKQYRFMEAAEADRIFKTLLDPEVLGAQTGTPDSLRQAADSLHSLFTTRRPDILFIIMESFSSKLMATLGGEPNVAVHLDSLSCEGVLFTNFYANSFRTDRGLVAILSGYPAQPTTSIMKYPRKTQSIPAIASSLRKVGYETKYYYGGDADFTNMRSYLMSSGFEDIVADRDFPAAERLSKWGVHDHLVFKRLLGDLKNEAAGKDVHHPSFRVLQTSSSHEPFEVPFHRLENKSLNAFAYTDSCIGDFVKQFRKLPQWKNTVVVLVPDHLGAYPEDISNLTVERYQIPLLLLGGAICKPGRVKVYGSQHDMAATLLAQLELPHGEFTFSKDMLNPNSPHFAFFTVPDAFGMVTKDNRVIFDCQAGSVVMDEGMVKGKNLPSGKAYLQKLYDDIDKR